MLNPAEDIQCLCMISEKQKSKVYLASAAGYPAPVIVKEYRTSNIEVRFQFYQNMKKLGGIYTPVLYEVRKEPDCLVLIEENIEGVSLREKLQDGLTEEECGKYLSGLCEALQFFHEQVPPVIHRDIKPENILITREGEVRLVDFDAAKVYQEGKKEDTVLLGTKGYAAPEQYGFAPADVRTDIYAVGVVAKELVEKAGLKSRRIRKVIARCMNIDPARRYQSMKELKEVFEQVFDGTPPVFWRRVWVVLMAVMAAAWLGLAGYNRKLGQDITDLQEKLQDTPEGGQEESYEENR